MNRLYKLNRQIHVYIFKSKYSIVFKIWTIEFRFYSVPTWALQDRRTFLRCNDETASSSPSHCGSLKHTHTHTHTHTLRLLAHVGVYICGSVMYSNWCDFACSCAVSMKIMWVGKSSWRHPQNREKTHKGFIKKWNDSPLCFRITVCW